MEWKERIGQRRIPRRLFYPHALRRDRTCDPRSSRTLAIQPPNPVQQILIRSVGVDDGREGAYVTSESLGEKKIAGCSDTLVTAV